MVDDAETEDEIEKIRKERRLLDAEKLVVEVLGSDIAAEKLECEVKALRRIKAEETLGRLPSSSRLAEEAKEIIAVAAAEIGDALSVERADVGRDSIPLHVAPPLGVDLVAEKLERTFPPGNQRLDRARQSIVLVSAQIARLTDANRRFIESRAGSTHGKPREKLLHLRPKRALERREAQTALCIELLEAELRGVFRENVGHDALLAYLR